MQTNKKLTTVLSVLLCALLVLSACNPYVACSWTLSEFDDSVSLHTELQTEYLLGDYKNVTNFARGKEELSHPNAVSLSWAADYDKKAKLSHYVVEIEDAADLYDTIRISTTDTSVEVYNLCVGTAYLWRVTAHFSDGKTNSSDWSAFLTKDAPPRNLYVEGITNVRDLGGWLTAEGRVRQGMIYRCGKLNESGTLQPDGTVAVNVEITAAGIEMMRNVLGVKSEIDLRMKEAHDCEVGGITSSPLGEDVNYYNCELEWDQGNYLTDNIESVKYFFELASDINNYPIIFHCNIGTDRTGLFAFLINGLLGVDEEDLYRDYLFSNFGDIDNTRTLSNIQNNYLATIKNYRGATLAEKIENCLTELVGVPQSQLDTIKVILLEY